uniref:Ig-like domain-containing protein n=1 Tax=Lates calcarifer TaxID=8187 RepID=A0A4W6EEH6_LATCA
MISFFCFYFGETVTVTCLIYGGGNTEWEYEWSKPNSNTVPMHNEYIISASVSNSGNYRCRGKDKLDVYSSTEWSDILTLTVSVTNRAVVTLQPAWPKIYSGETITVRCEIQGGGDTEWEYEWETTTSFKPSNQHEHRISPASSSHSGDYWCKGRVKSSQQNSTGWSNCLTLKVFFDKPRPVLTVSPSWLSPGASVTLNCEVEHPSAGWRFYWYKTTHTAGYVCRAGRGDPVFYTENSEPKFVWSGGQFVIYREERITLRCEIKNGGNSKWEYEWKTTTSMKLSNNDQFMITAYVFHNGYYKCRGRDISGQFKTKWSGAFKLTVYARFFFFYYKYSLILNIHRQDGGSTGIRLFPNQQKGTTEYYGYLVAPMGLKRIPTSLMGQHTQHDTSAELEEDTLCSTLIIVNQSSSGLKVSFSLCFLLCFSYKTYLFKMIFADNQPC